MTDDFERMSRTAAADADRAKSGRIERQRRLQNRSKRLRRVFRYSALICGLGALGLVYRAAHLESAVVVVFACVLFLLTIVAGGALFFMGGLAVGGAERFLTKRERDLLDR